MLKIESAAIRKDGIVYAGRRHCDIYCNRSRPKGFLRGGEEGFITNEKPERFVDREEAAKIAMAAGQVSYPVRRLISEDII